MITPAFFKQYIANFPALAWGNVHNALIQCKYINEEYHETNYNKVKGDIFEYLCKYIYIMEGYTAYLYNELTAQLKHDLGLPNTDKGIDLIITKDNIEYIGVQCKWRGKASQSIKRMYVTAFLHEINRSKLAYGIMFTNTNNMTPEFDNNDKLKWYLRNDLLKDVNKALYDYIQTNLNTHHNVYAKKEIVEMREYQKEAVQKLFDCKDKNKQCIMACGTGKTVVMQEYLKKKCCSKKKVVLLFPSLYLIGQVYRQLKKHLAKQYNYLCICSQMDKNTLSMGEGDEIDNDRLMKEFIAKDANKLFTTDEAVINERLKDDSILILCTYQSCQLLKGHNFDIGIFDEAHKTVNNDAFGFMLTDDNCKINERVYMTATPRYFKGDDSDVVSMCNEKIYGKEVYNYTFKDAIKDNYILDFQVITYVVPPDLNAIVQEKYIKQDGLKVNANCVVSAIQLAQHIKNHGESRKILTYHNTVANAMAYKKTLSYIFDKYGVVANIYVMSGKTSISNREIIFDEFEKSNVSVICSARVLNEGVNIPCVDTVMFVDPRKSTIDVTQCVGRAMRLFGGLAKCFVIIPVLYDNVEGVHSFGNVISVLTAMNELDGNIVEYFTVKNANDKIVMRNMGDIVDLNYVVDVKWCVGDVMDKLSLKVLESNYFSFEYKKALLFEYVNEYKCAPSSTTEYKGKKIGSWLSDQKKRLGSVDSSVYKQLSVNPAIKECLDKYIEHKHKTKDKIKLSQDELHTLLFEYVNEYKCVPSATTQYRGHNIGSWFHGRKKGAINIDSGAYKQLSINEIVKKSLDEYIEHKHETKDKIRLSWNESRDLLFEFVNENKCVPSKKTLYKGHYIGQWFQSNKPDAINVDSVIYKQLAENELVKKGLDEFLEYKDKTKDKIKLSFDELRILLFEYVDENKCVPTKNTIYKGHRIDCFWGHTKQKVNDNESDIYKQFAVNPIIKKSIDEYIEHKHKTKDKVKLSFDEWSTLLFEYVDENKCVPSHNTIYKGHRIDYFLGHIKRKITSNESDIYKQFAVNLIIKKSLDDYLDPTIRWNKWRDLLFEYANEYKCAPSSTTEYKGQKIGSWFHGKKHEATNIDSIVYKQLSVNPIIKECLDEYIGYTHATKDKVKLSWGEWSTLLLEYVNENKRVPPQNTIYKGYRIDCFWGHTKQKITSNESDIYKQFAVNPIIKKSLDEFLDPTIRWNKWRDLLFEYANEYKCAPSSTTEYKGQKIGSWLSDRKKQTDSIDSSVYKQLSVNPIIKECLDKHIEYKHKNKDKIRLTWDESRTLLFEYISEHKCIPPAKTQYKGHNLGGWYHGMKKGVNSIDSVAYKQLSINSLIKENLDEYIEYKHATKDKIKLLYEDRCDLLFEYVNEYKCVPSQGTIYKNYRIDYFWGHIKQKVNNNESNIYKQFAVNPIIKKRLDEFLEYKNKTKDKVALSFDESCTLLFEYVSEHKRVPSAITQHKGHNIGNWYQHQKCDNIDPEIYNKLIVNDIVKKNLDTYIKDRQAIQNITDSIVKSNDTTVDIINKSNDPNNAPIIKTPVMKPKPKAKKSKTKAKAKRKYTIIVE